MVMGTLANLYAIQQAFSIMKTVDKEDTKNIKSNDLMDNQLPKLELNNKSMYEHFKIKKFILFSSLTCT